MHRKTVTFQAPLDNSVLYLEQFLSDVAKNGLKSASGSYTGDGVSGKIITLDFTPVLVIVSKFINLGTETSYPVSGNFVFSLRSNEGISYIPGTGFVKDAVTGISANTFTLSNNANVNTADTEYIFLAVG
jgi:hypothetical protein